MANEFNPWWIAGQHGPSPQEINALRPAKGWAYVREQVYANRGETAPPLPTKRRRHVPMHVYPKLATPEDSTEVLGDILECRERTQPQLPADGSVPTGSAQPTAASAPAEQTHHHKAGR